MVIISCATKFHAFNLAEQLERNELLSRLYTTYASQKNTVFKEFIKRIDKEKISPEKITTNIPLAIRKKLVRSREKNFSIIEEYDKWVANRISKYNKGGKVFIGWSSMSLHSLRTAKQKGMITIVERGSAHIEVQKEIMAPEYARFGEKIKTIPPVIKKELKEYEECDFISVPSKFALNSFLQKGISVEKMFLNPYGVSSFFTQKKRNDNKFRILYLGSSTILKGVIYLYQALEKLDIPKEKYEVWFIGKIDNSIAPIFQKMKKKNWRNLGFINHYLLSDYISQCDVAIQPSLQEGLSMVIPQVLSCGVPVIASTNTGGEMVITDGYNGYIVPIRNPDAIKEKIEILYRSPEILEQIKKHCSDYANELSWQNYGDRYSKFLLQII